MTGFTPVFGAGSTIYPADVSYRPVTIAANLALQWPTEVNTSSNVTAGIMDITASVGSLSIAMPDATQTSTGQAVLFNNVGGNTFTVTSSTAGCS